MKDKLFLSNISIKNFATFTDQTVTFENSFNAIIGETGSGKSLLLDAIQLVLGSRADKKLVRKGSDFSSIEAIFSCHDPLIISYFDDLGFPIEDNEIIVKRIIYSTGKSKSFLNHQSATLITLQNFSRRFIDLVGQFENQKLLSENYQLKLLDNFAKLNNLRAEFEDYYSKLNETNVKIEKLESKKTEQAQRLDYVNFQINELNQLDPSVEDEEQLIIQKNNIANLERRINLVNEINEIFESSDSNFAGLNEQLSLLEKKLTQSQDLISEKLINTFFNVKESLQEISYEVTLLQNQNLDEDELSATIDRLDLYQKLKNKFATDTDGLVKTYKSFLKEQDELKSLDINFDKLLLKKETLKSTCFELANKLHSKREAAALKLSEKLTSTIQSLRMFGASIKLNCAKYQELNSQGLTTVSFLAQTNLGEGFFKVKDVASGGELSRILLAVRQVLASKDSINIFLFDEIDTGMGGETALHIGKALDKVSKESQVIAITHLPQIANYAKKLIVVSKSIQTQDDSKRTISVIKEIKESAKSKFVQGMTPLA